MGEAFLVRRGGFVNFNGKRAVNIFMQLDEPTPSDVGDIWIKTDQTIHDIIFRNRDPESPADMQVVIKLTDNELKINIAKAMEFLGIPQDYVVVTYPQLETFDTIAQNKVKIWRNAYLEMMARLGTIKYWDAAENKWVYLDAYYWDGSEWRMLSASKHYSYVASGNLYKISPNGEILWALPPETLPSDPIGYFTRVMLGPDNCLYSYTRYANKSGGAYSSSYLYKQDLDGNTIHRISFGDYFRVLNMMVDLDGCLYVLGSGLGGTGSGTISLYKFDPNGNQVYKSNILSDYTFYDSAFCLNELYLLCYSSSTYLTKVDLLTGQRIWHTRTADFSVASPRYTITDSDGYVYLITTGSYPRIYKIDPNSPSVVWSKNLVDDSASSYIPACHFVPNYIYYIYRKSSNYYILTKLDLDGNQVSNYGFTRSASPVYVAGIDPDRCVYIRYTTTNTELQKLSPDCEVIWTALLDIVRGIDYAIVWDFAVYPSAALYPHLW